MVVKNIYRIFLSRANIFFSFYMFSTFHLKKRSFSFLLYVTDIARDIRTDRLLLYLNNLPSILAINKICSNFFFLQKKIIVALLNEFLFLVIFNAISIFFKVSTSKIYFSGFLFQLLLL